MPMVTWLHPLIHADYRGDTVEEKLLSRLQLTTDLLITPYRIDFKYLKHNKIQKINCYIVMAVSTRLYGFEASAL